MNRILALALYTLALSLLPSLLAAQESPPTLSLAARERLLVLAPPDDETLGAAGLISQVMEHGGSAREVVVTAGDADNELLAILRNSQPTLIPFPDVMENDSDHAELGDSTAPQKQRRHC